MPLTAYSKRLLEKGFTTQWPEQQQAAFASLFGSPDGRYPASAEKSVTLRAPQFKADSGVPFAAYIHPSNPSSGAYGGMSIAIFPVADAPCLLSFVVGTQGLSPDEEILGRPGHARKVQAICAWLNRKHGHGKPVAWAKEDPVRTEQDLPSNIAKQFPPYRSVFDRYGRVLYAIFVPTEDEAATRDAVTAFLDLMFDERGYRPLAALLPDYERIRSEWFQHLMPDVTAVRRRFAFVKLWPQLRVIEEFGCPFMAKAFVDLTSIFVEHATREAFDLVPGHSYFLERDESAARGRLKVTLGPLLEEYLAQGYVAGFSEPIRSYLQWIESL